MSNGKVIAKKTRITKKSCKNKHKMDTKVFQKKNMEEIDMKICLKKISKNLKNTEKAIAN